MQFTPIDKTNAHKVAAYYKSCAYKISDYSIGIKLMWQNGGYEYAETHGCLVVKAKWSGQTYFDYPVPSSPQADVRAALEECGKYCAEHFIPFYLDVVPADAVCSILSCYPNIEIGEQRNLDDYLYIASDFIHFQGKKYAGQRNHIRKFHSLYPSAKFEIFEEKDKPRVCEFWKKFGDRNDSPSAKTELKYAHAMTEYVGADLFKCGGYTLNGEVISFCLGEICGETLIDHIEKALPEYEGIYPATVQEYAKTFATDVKYINREDDSGNRGLRISKLQYQPSEILRKHTVHVKTALNRLKKVPTVKGENDISLTPITEKDIPVYNRLCLNDERNRWWGYDYRVDCPTPCRDYFYRDQKKDFSARVAMNFAIRKDKKFVGEVILYNFDFKGGAEIGVRILPEADGQGIGRYAFNLAADYAIYVLELQEINAKCMKENIASEKMLSSIMRKVGEDDIYFYYQKIV
jgi:hypothetical protein